MPSSDDRPNIVFILSDDHGYGDASVYGGPNVQTPHIDRIAEAGVRFTQFYANSPVCSPSRAALMTGRYPDLVGVPGVIRTHETNSWGYFDPTAVTLPQMLARGGYQTALVGKWHLGLEQENHPCRRGFDHFYGFLGDMMDDYYTHLRFGHNYMRHDAQTIDPQGHATDVFTDRACRFIQEKADGGQRFFLCLAYNAPHTPIQPPDEWVDRVRQREPGIDDQRAKYVALVEHMDAGIGRVLDTLQQTGMSDDTLVIYASDNGGFVESGACNGPLRGEKPQVYEGGIRVPCCAMWPGHIEPGQVTDQVAMLMDWFATMCEVASVDIDHEVEARSILPLLLGGSVDFDDRYYYWVRRDGGQTDDKPYLGQAYHAVRHGNVKLLHDHPFAPLEIYDIAADMQEQHNLAATDHPQAASLCKFMQEQVRLAGAVPWRKR